MTQEFGRRAYIKRSKKKRGKYHDLMRNLTNRQVHNKIIEKHSEFEKPYRTPNYHEMQHFHPSGYAIPYRSGPTDANPVIAVNCNGALLIATTSDGDMPTIECGGNTILIMGGHDGQGQPWDEEDIKRPWSLHSL